MRFLGAKVNKMEHAVKKTGILRSLRYFLSHNKLGELLVIQGVITPYDLKRALSSQKKTQRPLGKVFLELGLITKGELYYLLFKQQSLRLTAAAILCFSASSGFIRQSRAAGFRDSSAPNIVLASAHSVHFDDMDTYPALFGADEKQSKKLDAFTKWLDVFERLDKELQSKDAKRVIHAMKIELSEYRSSSIFEMAKNVDEMMNKKKYIIDQKNWGKSDYWETPVEFLTRGGDCEDFAIAKYIALRALGVPESRLRVAIVQDLKKNMPHAVLVVYTERGPFILDNQSEIMRSANAIEHYKPIYSINRQAWWLHTTPDSASNSIVASAK